MNKSQLFARFFICFALCLSLFFIPISFASAMQVSPPIPIHPTKSPPILPTESIKFQINVTNADVIIQDVTLFFSVDKYEPQNYNHISMSLTSEQGSNQTWECSIPPILEENTKIFFYSEIIDSTGNDHTNVTREDPSILFVNESGTVSFNIESFVITKIYDKELLADVSVTIDSYFPPYEDVLKIEVKNGEQQVDSIILRNGENDARFEFNEQVKHERLVLSANPDSDTSKFPFDEYFLNLTFVHPYTKASMDVFFSENETELHNWNHIITSETALEHDGSKIKIVASIERTIYERITYFMPTIIFSFMLGVTLVLPSAEFLKSKLTVFLSLFVFSWQYGNYIRDVVPEVAVGSNSIELSIAFFGYFTGIFLICTFLEKFRKSEIDYRKWCYIQKISVDTWALLIVLILYFAFVFFEIPYFWNFVVLFGLSFGWLLARNKKIKQLLENF